MNKNTDKVDWEALGMMSEAQFQEIKNNFKRTEEEGKKNILKHFDRLHDKLFTFNNVLIAGYFALAKVFESIFTFEIIIPLINMGFLIIIEYRMMEKGRFESNIGEKNQTDINNYIPTIKATNNYSLFTTFSTLIVTLYFLYRLLCI